MGEKEAPAIGLWLPEVSWLAEVGSVPSDSQPEPRLDELPPLSAPHVCSTPCAVLILLAQENGWKGDGMAAVCPHPAVKGVGYPRWPLLVPPWWHLPDDENAWGDAREGCTPCVGEEEDEPASDSSSMPHGSAGGAGSSDIDDHDWRAATMAAMEGRPDA